MSQIATEHRSSFNVYHQLKRTTSRLFRAFTTSSAPPSPVHHYHKHHPQPIIIPLSSSASSASSLRTTRTRATARTAPTARTAATRAATRISSPPTTTTTAAAAAAEANAPFKRTASSKSWAVRPNQLLTRLRNTHSRLRSFSSATTIKPPSSLISSERPPASSKVRPFRLLHPPRTSSRTPNAQLLTTSKSLSNINLHSFNSLQDPQQQPGRPHTTYCPTPTTASSVCSYSTAATPASARLRTPTTASLNADRRSYIHSILPSDEDGASTVQEHLQIYDYYQQDGGDDHQQEQDTPHQRRHHHGAQGRARMQSHNRARQTIYVPIEHHSSQQSYLPHRAFHSPSTPAYPPINKRHSPTEIALNQLDEILRRGGGGGGGGGGGALQNRPIEPPPPAPLPMPPPSSLTPALYALSPPHRPPRKPGVGAAAAAAQRRGAQQQQHRTGELGTLKGDAHKPIQTHAWKSVSISAAAAFPLPPQTTTTTTTSTGQPSPASPSTSVHDSRRRQPGSSSFRRPPAVAVAPPSSASDCSSDESAASSTTTSSRSRNPDPFQRFTSAANLPRRQHQQQQPHQPLQLPTRNCSLSNLHAAPSSASSYDRRHCHQRPTHHR